MQEPFKLALRSSSIQAVFDRITNLAGTRYQIVRPLVGSLSVLRYPLVMSLRKQIEKKIEN
jgi:hypothetical protein